MGMKELRDALHKLITNAIDDDTDETPEDRELLDAIAMTITHDADDLVAETEHALAAKAERRRQAIEGTFKSGPAMKAFMDDNNTNLQDLVAETTAHPVGSRKPIDFSPYIDVSPATHDVDDLAEDDGDDADFDEPVSAGEHEQPRPRRSRRRSR